MRLEVARKRFSERSDPPEHLLEEVEALTVERDVARLAIERIDAWYRANPDQMDTKVVEVIWLDMVRPNLPDSRRYNLDD